MPKNTLPKHKNNYKTKLTNDDATYLFVLKLQKVPIKPKKLNDNSKKT